MMSAFISTIEKWGNRLPPPTALFIYLCAVTVFASWLSHLAGIQAIHPVTGETLFAKSLLSREGITYALENAVKNFVSFAPVGTMLVAIMGIGIAEHSGLLPDLLSKVAKRFHGSILVFAIALLGVLSSIGADSGYVILIPLAALLFLQAKAHPIAGICVAFAGVSAGYSANLIIGPVDIMLSGISTEAIKTIANQQTVSVASNYYFMATSVFLIAGIITLIHHFVTKQQVKTLSVTSPSDFKPSNNARSTKALIGTALAFIIYLVILLTLTLPHDGILRSSAGQLLPSPFMNSIVILIALGAGICGIIYGRLSGTYHHWHDAIGGMESHIATMASYLVLMFFAAQFVNWFNWSQLGSIIAIGGAQLLKDFAIHQHLTLIAFVFIAALINLFIGSASAKWALLAPIFLPMFYLSGITPEAAQIAYRIGDSSTNIITPLMPYFGVIIAFMQRYKHDIGAGTIISLMLPYSVALFLSWLALLLVWLLLDLPFGPNAI